MLQQLFAGGHKSSETKQHSPFLAGLLSVCCFLVFASAANAQTQPSLLRGVNNVQLGWKTPEQRRREADEMARAGVGSVRISLVRPYSSTIDAISQLSQRGISVALIVRLGAGDLVDEGLTPRPGRGTLHDVLPLSRLNVPHFEKAVGNLLRQIDASAPLVAAIEVGNEINWAGFNGDLQLLPPGNQPWPGAPALDAIKNPAIYLEGLRRYVAAVAAVKRLRDASRNLRGAKIISAGLAWIPIAFAAKLGAEYVDYSETLTRLRSLGLDQYADGYGLHYYPMMNSTRPRRAVEFGKLIQQCKTAGGGHPCWITEWGVIEKDLSCPPVAGRRVPVMREIKDLIIAASKKREVVASYYFDWNGPLKAFSIWRCGELTAGGRTILDP
ncbi:MAG: hypothetical protein R3D44_03415 [Hyphomicrobiaceae bacterium]